VSASGGFPPTCAVFVPSSLATVIMPPTSCMAGQLACGRRGVEGDHSEARHDDGWNSAYLYTRQRPPQMRVAGSLEIRT
jgi:hypothetical protein